MTTAEIDRQKDRENSHVTVEGWLGAFGTEEGYQFKSRESQTQFH